MSSRGLIAQVDPGRPWGTLVIRATTRMGQGRIRIYSHWRFVGTSTDGVNAFRKERSCLSHNCY